MAWNLQAKLPPNDTIRLFDINKAAAAKLAQEIKSQQAGGATTELADNAADASKEAVRAVSCSLPSVGNTGFHDEFVLSMTF